MDPSARLFLIVCSIVAALGVIMIVGSLVGATMKYGRRQTLDPELNARFQRVEDIEQMRYINAWQARKGARRARRRALVQSFRDEVLRRR